MKVNKSIRGKLYTYFRDRLDLKPSTKGFLRGDCPFCFGKFCFGVNIYTNKINCFKDGCSNWLPGQANPLLELVCKLEDFTEIEEARKLIDVRQEYELRDIKTTVKSKKSKVTLPESFAPIWEVDGRDRKSVV